MLGALFALVVALAGHLAFAAAPNCVTPPAGLVAWWPGEGNGTEVVNGNHGTLLNGVTFGAGRVGQAFSFDGVNDSIQVGDVEALKLTNSLTIEAWIFLPSYPVETNNFGLSFIAFRGDNQDALDPYYLAVEWQGRARFHIASLTATEDLYAPVPTNRFFHLAATLEHATGLMKLYVDGALASQTNTPVRPFRNLNPNLSPGFAIGNHPAPSPYNFPFKGQIDELSIYNRALAAGEVAAIVTADSTGKCRPPLFTQQPQSQAVPICSNVLFAATANGLPPLRYRWFFNGQPINNATNASLSLTNVKAIAAGNYHVVASNNFGAVTSEVATLTVLPAPEIPVFLSGIRDDGQFLSGGETLVNPVTNLMLTASVFGVNLAENHNAQIEIYDGDRRLFGRVFDLTDYPMNFTWVDVPLGYHCLVAVVTDEDACGNPRVSTSFSICFTVVGAQIGFSDVLNLQTILAPPGLTNTAISCSLRVQNQGTVASNPLRVRLHRSQTYFAIGSLPDPVPSFSEPFFAFAATNAALATGGSFTVNVPFASNVICPPMARIDEFNFSDRWQYHIFATLEELVGSKWAFIDRVKVFSSVPEIWFPGNDGAVGSDPLVSTNQHSFVTTLSILGNTNIQEGSIGAFVALASLNDGATGSVNATWQSPPLSISSDGVFTAPLVQSNLTVDLNATFTRRTTRSATKRITIVNVGDPVTITSHPSNKVAAVGSNATWSVVANGTPAPAYQWRMNGTNLVGATAPTLTITNVQLAHAGAYSVAVSNLLGVVTSSTGALTVVTRPLITTPFRDTTGAFRFSVQGTPGSPCQIESCTNLPQWTLLTNVTLGMSPAMLTNLMTGPRRFFRVRIDTSP